MNECMASDVQQMLPDLLHNALPATERERVEQHVVACESCREELRVLRAVKDAGVWGAVALAMLGLGVLTLSGFSIGYGEALTWAATCVDPSLPAVLIASDLGRPVYERMGYVATSRWTLWHRPDSAG